VGLRPLGDRVVVKTLALEEKTKSGIVLPDTAKEKPQQGEVVAVGSGYDSDNGEKIPLAVKVGDRVIYSKYAGTEVKIDGQEFLILQERDLLATID
jgi:chaperonin GroES